MALPAPDAIDRREALRRAVLLFGGALSAPTVTALLAACEARGKPHAAAFRVLSPAQADLVATIAEHILPGTDTPGARAARVDQFIDAMLADGYAARERERFLAGLAELDARSRSSCGRPFLECGAERQRSMLEGFDRDGDRFFRGMKELTIVGYYTSEIGATQELRHAPLPGRFEGCVPFEEIGRTWAV